MTNHFPLLARLKGHKNSDPPTICYIAQSNCLVSAEKNYDVDRIANNEEPMAGDDPNTAPSYIA